MTNLGKRYEQHILEIGVKSNTPEYFRRYNSLKKYGEVRPKRSKTK